MTFSWASRCWNGVYPSVNNHHHMWPHITLTHLIHTNHNEYRIRLFKLCSYCSETHSMGSALFIHCILCFVGNNYSSSGLYQDREREWEREIQQQTAWLLNHRKSCFVSQHTMMGSETTAALTCFCLCSTTMTSDYKSKAGTGNRRTNPVSWFTEDPNPLTLRLNGRNVLP